jgi:SAM-dependent methyltransferase
VSAYDAIAELYDDWSRSVTEDVGFYVEEARGLAGPVVELGVGTGRIALPIAAAGVPLIGVDSSPGMLAVARRRAEKAGLAHLLDLREGDFRHPPVEERVELVIAPFRSLLHLESDEARREVLAAVYGLLVPGGRFVFDVFAPSREDIDETNGRWLEREPGIWERADWDERARTLTLALRGPESSTSMRLSWIAPERWERLLVGAGFEIDACFGWFDRRAQDGLEDSIWLTRRPAG